MNSALKKLRRPFWRCFGVNFRMEHMERNLAEIDMDLRVIHYSRYFDSESIFIATAFHEIGHLLASSRSSKRRYEEKCWEIGFALMEGMFNIKKTPEMELHAKYCVSTYGT